MMVITSLSRDYHQLKKVYHQRGCRQARSLRVGENARNGQVAIGIWGGWWFGRNGLSGRGEGMGWRSGVVALRFEDAAGRMDVVGFRWQVAAARWQAMAGAAMRAAVAAADPLRNWRTKNLKDPYRHSQRKSRSYSSGLLRFTALFFVVGVQRRGGSEMTSCPLSPWRLRISAAIRCTSLSNCAARRRLIERISSFGSGIIFGRLELLWCTDDGRNKSSLSTRSGNLSL